MKTLDGILNSSPKPFNKKDDLPVVLLDSDTVCFRASAATDGRMYLVGVNAFKYKSDAVKYCNKEGIPVDEIDIDFYPEPLSHALSVVKGALRGIKAFADKKYGIDSYTVEAFHTGPINFRHNILDGYKESRKGTRRPEHLKDCKRYVGSKYPTFEEDGLEADDLIGIRAYELRAKGIEYLVVTNDKDLKTIPGEGYDWVKQEPYSNTDVESMLFFYSQCIAGDDTDDIPGVPGLGINKNGTGRATKIINKLYKDLTESDGDLPLIVLERLLYNEALEQWVLGGPGKGGYYGCEPWDVVEEKFEQSAKCLYILHKKGQLWKKPTNKENNYA